MTRVGVAADAESVGMCPDRLAQVQALCRGHVDRGYVDRGEKSFAQCLLARGNTGCPKSKCSLLWSPSKVWTPHNKNQFENCPVHATAENRDLANE
jgi:hypothetical protein